MALEEPSMQEGKGNMHPPRGKIHLQGLQVWEEDAQGLSMAIEASQFCAELEREFRWKKSCAMGLGIFCLPQKATES